MSTTKPPSFLDALVIAAHPDDAEIFAGGTLLALKKLGRKVGVLDLTRGEAGTYGTPEIRKKELDVASKILGLDARETLDFPDGGIENNLENRLRVIEVIRKLRPKVLISFRPNTRHPDHHHTGEIARDVLFLSGLEKIKTESPAFRASSLIQFPEFHSLEKPDFVVDVSEVWEKKMEAIRAYGSQVIQPGESDAGSKTFIRSEDFWRVLEAKAVLAGNFIGAKYGEAFHSRTPIRVADLTQAFGK
ncbi:MAG: bacillithiol biosynthesis deacetylase BshB1 [Spirochaetia bacterium]|nr:bacillithiol biosynthesis deacetylase BshB1 [Spirochaetia bacterium]